MIKGASQADVAALAVSARRGEFKKGFRGGQTRERGILALTLGVSHISYRGDRQQDGWPHRGVEQGALRPDSAACPTVPQKDVSLCHKKAGSVHSGFGLERGQCGGRGGFQRVSLVEELVRSVREQPPRFHPGWSFGFLGTERARGEAPLRIPVLDSFKDHGVYAVGRAESGMVETGMNVVALPSNQRFAVVEVRVNDEMVPTAFPGENSPERNVATELIGATRSDISDGSVLSCVVSPSQVVNKIICRLKIVDLPEDIKLMTAGLGCVFHANTCEEACTVKKIFETTSERTGKVIKSPAFATIDNVAVVLLEFAQSVAVEQYKYFDFPGRFALRAGNVTMAFGTVTKFPPAGGSS